LVRGLFSSLDVQTYIPPTSGPLITFLGPFGGAQMPQNSPKKNISSLFWTISPTQMGLLIWLGAYFQASTLGHLSHQLVSLPVPFWGQFGGAQMPQSRIEKKHFLIVQDSFSNKNRPNDLVRGPFGGYTLGLTSGPPAGLCVLFLVHLGVP
jgi:hypothetical protein